MGVADDRLVRAVRAHGLAYPGAHTKSPWPGHLDLAVDDKTFCYLPVDGAPLSVSCKLPHSAAIALLLPHTKPTAYGLGRSGWVTLTPPPGKRPPLALLLAWVEESYRAQAGKKRVAALEVLRTKPSVAKARRSTTLARSRR